jgi:PTH1 family peptidyl-tRNA hydrolase
MWLVVGLGNPGSEYARTRHNVGFMIVDQLSGRTAGGSAKAKLGAELCEGKLGDERVLLCKPMEFMNTSGDAVNRVATFWKVPKERVLVVHDDLDIEFGRLKLGTGGGAGGHNGLRSLIANLGAEFGRVRVGIGRPPVGDTVGYVLGAFSRAEQKDLPALLQDASDAVEAVVRQGMPAAMNKFNRKSDDAKKKSEKPNQGAS